jgi:hypothetical protein
VGVQGRQISGSISLLAPLLAACVAVMIPARADAEPPQFGVEVGVGTALGLSPYLRNEVLTEPDPSTTDASGRSWLLPSLADVETGGATAVSLRLVASNIAAGLSFKWFDLPAYEIHHRGDRLIPPNRRRADGSVDDSGVEYQPIEPPIEQAIPERVRNSLMIIGLGGDYRFHWPGEAFDVFVPVGAEVVLTHVTRPAGPYRLGLGASSGVGATFSLGGRLSLVLDARLHALATGHYGRRSDSARRSAAIGESTEAAFFSTLTYASANLALQFKIR